MTTINGRRLVGHSTWTGYPATSKAREHTQLAVNMLVANLHVAYDGDVYFHTIKTMAAATVISRIVVFIVVLRRV